MRRQARELALQILFQIEFAPQISFDDILQVFEASVSKEVIDYADQVIKGVIEHKIPIDQKIQSLSKNWKLSRMPLVDINILRIAAFEMCYMSPILKPNIAINEAVEIAKKYGSTESGAFINGILDQIKTENGKAEQP
jgi:N utilization substance protein B